MSKRKTTGGYQPESTATKLGNPPNGGSGVETYKERTLAEFPVGDVELLEIVDYKLCLQFSNGALENEVRNLIKNGWKTIGAPGYSEKDGRLHWFQGVVKLANPEIGE